jgi:hypothetical protein
MGNTSLKEPHPTSVSLKGQCPDDRTTVGCAYKRNLPLAETASELILYLKRTVSRDKRGDIFKEPLLELLYICGVYIHKKSLPT